MATNNYVIKPKITKAIIQASFNFKRLFDEYCKELKKEEKLYYREFHRIWIQDSFLRAEFKKQVKLTFDIINYHKYDQLNTAQKRKKMFIEQPPIINEHIQKFYARFFSDKNLADVTEPKEKDIMIELKQIYQSKQLSEELQETLPVNSLSQNKFKI